MDNENMVEFWRNNYEENIFSILDENNIEGYLQKQIKCLNLNKYILGTKRISNYIEEVL